MHWQNRAEGTARSGRVLRAHRLDQGSAATALGCDGSGGTGSGGNSTARIGLGALGHVSGLRSLGSGRGLEQGMGTAGPGHEHPRDSRNRRQWSGSGTDAGS